MKYFIYVVFLQVIFCQNFSNFSFTGAKSMGMAGAVVSNINDSESVFYNPSGLVLSDDYSVILGTTMLYDLNFLKHQFLSISFPNQVAISFQQLSTDSKGMFSNGGSSISNLSNEQLISFSQGFNLLNDANSTLSIGYNINALVFNQAGSAGPSGDGTDGLPSSSYAVIDSGYKYMYDRYNDVYRFVPLNGDIAGLCARTDSIADPFFSPAGFNRGQIRGAVKLAFNPNQTQRDELYKARINPVVAFPGQGTVLFGDKTAQSKPSAFDRINVRRLFITLEKAVSTAAKFQLFEFNDEFTRAQFRNLVEPFLRDVQGRRGITDFSVVCDDSNNTGDVIDRNEFRADIFVKPARSINFIQLNFIATRSGVAFSEVAGS